jgi:hypothetical protein
MKSVKYVSAAVIVLIFAATLHYFLPQVDVARIIGTDVKRVDTPETSADANGEAIVRTADVYFILAETDTGAVRNYRNEDAFIYGKFDSSNLHTRARSISQDEGNTVAIRHYGWRISLLSMFPNATSVWEVAPGYRHLPIFNIASLALLFGGLGYAAFRVRKAQARKAEARALRDAERAAENARREQERAERAAQSPDGQDRDKALQDFLGDGASGSGSGSGNT